MLKWHSIRTKLNPCKLAFMDGGGIIWWVRESGDRGWAFRFTDLSESAVSLSLDVFSPQTNQRS
jgi:hypothetical protein